MKMEEKPLKGLLKYYKSKLLELNETQCLAVEINDSENASVINFLNILRYASGLIDSL